MPRKRKSSSTGKSRINPLKIVIAVCALLLVLLVVGLLIVKSSIQGWLKGEEFREWLTRKASVVLKSEIDLAELKWQGSEVYADHFRATGYEDAAFSALHLDGVRAKAGGVSGGAFQVPEVSVNRFDLRFSDNRKRRSRTTETVGDSSGGGPDVPDWLAKYLPTQAEVGEITLSSARVEVKNPGGSIPFLLNGTRARVVPDFRTSVWEIAGQGGKLVIPNQPEIRLKDLKMRWRESELFIDQCGLGMYGNGHVDGSGEISFAGEGNFDLELNLSAIEIDDLVTGEWKERLNGTIEGLVRITGSPGAFVYEGEMQVADAVIESVPVLTVIAEYTRNEQFKHLVLSEARTDFRREGERLELTDLVLQSDGLVRVEGNLTMVGEAMNGSFRVGVTPGTLRWIPGAERKVFVEEDAGFLWTPMTLTGTLNEPKEDLSGRLIAAAGEAILKELPEGLLKEAQKFLGPDSEGASPGGIIEQGKPILDLLTPFLKGL